ncbi:MAG TPA: glycosyltransferase family A protein [Blastocatellia bacterium]|nr:glycosyltransferase family A protein [Blastocatellia bacterium]
MEPIFSVILPTYNRAYVLWKAVASVVAQTERRWELIVVDDGSTDCTLRLVEEFHDARIRALSVTNQGPSAARNRGVEVARAPYVAYLDSDNTWHANFLEVMLEAINKDGEIVLWYCGQNSTFWERTADGQWALISQSPEPRAQYSYEDVWRLRGPDTSCMVHRREALERVGGWDEQCRWVEDWDLFLRIFLTHHGKVRWVPHILVEYRQVFGEGADGICAQAREDRFEEVGGRQYLLQKWGGHPDFDAADRLSKQADDLKLMRSAPRNISGA